ncbi:Gti1/Pac2 family transporter [Metarhizium robertsii]|uniref:Gti1/Pac2 family transporter n=1 Tax=Metarhizium robertsii TaxID=568076 RepID=A0A014P0X4_9HYPO|nr:Gti1/Pac2 family transporter [Metarhizium robertsii]
MDSCQAKKHSQLCPTWHGHISSTMDILILVEAYLRNHLSGVPRRPDDIEKRDLIKSGSVFIIDQHDSGIKRWTDGRSWSPSRIFGDFLLYTELERPWKSSIKPINVTIRGLSGRETSQSRCEKSLSEPQKRTRSFRGTAFSSYSLKSGGLVKKTITISYNHRSYHVISYYSVDDAFLGRLMTVSQDPALAGLLPRLELLLPRRLQPERAREARSHLSSGRSSRMNRQLEASDVTNVPPLGSLLNLHNSQHYEYGMHNLVRVGPESSLSAPASLENLRIR